MPTHIMYPYHVTDFTKGTHQVEKVGDYIGFVCSTCHYPMIYRAKIVVNIQHAPDKIDDMDAPCMMIPNYVLVCPKCNHINHFKEHLGPNITPIVAILHSKGYYVDKCSEGMKVNQDSHMMPYIKFKYPRQRTVLKYFPIHEPWFLDNEVSSITDSDGNALTIDASKMFILRCPNLDIPIRERMAYLRRWALALPTCFEEYFDQSMITTEAQEYSKHVNDPLDPEDITTTPPRDNTAVITKDESKTSDRKFYNTHREIADSVHPEGWVDPKKEHQKQVREKKRKASDARRHQFQSRHTTVNYTDFRKKK